ncbi:MAG: hypothetical protein K2Q20_10175, partial [Phycisphaerales bacterium]|nr:hypothetical protein [Phycisphaerales bacterium]
VLTSRLDCEFSRTPDRLPTRPYEPVPSRAATGNFSGYGSVCTPTACDGAGPNLGRFFDAYRCEDGAWLAAAGAIGPVSTRQLVAPGIFTSLYAGQFASLDPALSPIPLGNGISVSTNGNGVTSAGGYIIFFSPLRATFLRFDFERPIVAWTVDVLNAGGDGLFISTGNAEYDLSQLQAFNTGVSVPGSTTPGSVGVIERGPVSSLTIRMRDDDFQEDWVLQPTIRTVEAPGVCCRGATCALVGAGQPCSGANTKFVIGSACNASGVATGPCCYADFDKLNGVQVTDIFSYLSAWFAASPTAKVGGDGVATPSVADIFAFLSAWFARC